MRRSTLLVLCMLALGRQSQADDAKPLLVHPSPASGSLAVAGYDLASIRTFGFAPDIGSCLNDLTLALGSLQILAADEGAEPDVLADCQTGVVAAGVASGGKNLKLTSVSLSDPRTGLTVWWGYDATADGSSDSRVPVVIEHLKADRRAGSRVGR